MSSEEKERLGRELEECRARLREAESELWSTQERYTNLYNLAPVGHLTVDASGTIHQTNDMALEILGVRRDELLGQKVERFIAAVDQTRYEQFAALLFSQDAVQVTELRLVYPDSSEFYGELRGRRMTRADEKALGFIVVANVSERVRLFADVQHSRERLQLLTRKIVLAQEEERRRVARELHDEAGQLLTALKLSLEMLDEDLRAAQDDKAALELGQRQLASAISLSEKAMAHIRGLVHNLRPTALDDLGLNSALEGLCHDFAQRRDVSVAYHTNVEESLLLSSSVQIVAYRFLQEALTNVSKHAQATEVKVSVEKGAGNICLSVEDDGVGFDIFPATDGLGLLGMRERLESVGGKLEIHSRANDGTRLVATIPIDS